jgi:hypothetical protein
MQGYQHTATSLPTHPVILPRGTVTDSDVVEAATMAAEIAAESILDAASALILLCAKLDPTGKIIVHV